MRYPDRQLLFIMASISGALLIATSSTLAQSTSRTFLETGKTVSGRFLEYWNTHGGLMQQGYPISEEMQEVSETNGKSYTVQYFERAVFEKHPENAPPNDVLLSLLGVFLYQQKYPAGAPGQTPNAEANAQLFPETGHKVGGLFLDYWLKNGGLAQQGYPISDEFTERSDLDGKSYNVQYFQRAVFEHHPENAAPYNVLLSQLGTFRYRQKYGGISNPATPPVPPPPLASTTATAVPPAPPTHTQVPPEDTDTPTPRPTRTYTPVPTPTTCPVFGHLHLECQNLNGFLLLIPWNVTGGGGQIRGVLTSSEEGGRTITREVSGRSGQAGHSLLCGWEPGAFVSVSLEMYDECGHTVSAECGSYVYREPCR